MKTISIFVFLFSFYISTAQVAFDDYFVPKTMRVDYYHAGNSAGEQIYFEQAKMEPFWGGSKNSLTDKFNYGSYKFMVYDSSGNKLIYSRGFCSLFQEWQSTPEAKTLSRSFYETVIFPFPKKTVKLEIHSRNKKNNFSKIFEIYINPKNYFIKKEGPLRYDSYKLADSGDPSVKVDIVIVPDGYTKEELPKLKKDAERFAKYLFNHAPYTERKEKFNVWVVEAPSQESGTDLPGNNIWKNTIVNSNFWTFNSDRYLTTTDIKSMRDIAGNVPYDQIVVLVNSKTYGGGGVYNDFAVCSSDNEFSEFVFIHEFGHEFAGLADEYYDSEVSVENYYDYSVEPWEANITSNVDLNSKWKSMIGNDVPIPTPPEDRYKNKVGLFAGAGYSAKNLYRPYFNCEMKELMGGFCPVCIKAINDMIDFCTK
ncbi:MAG: peptidase M64 [Bacteroidia bacterium]|nr:peptidase M64 [Bacteroidia bacterium]